VATQEWLHKASTMNTHTHHTPHEGEDMEHSHIDKGHVGGGHALNDNTINQSSTHP